MRNAFLKSIVAFSLPLVFLSGCAKDQVKPDEGISPEKSASAAVAKKEAALVKPTVDNSAAEKAAADRAAAEKAAADRAAAEKAAADRAAAEKAAADRAAAEKAAAVTLSLKTVYFDFDSYILRQPDRDTLYKNAEYLLKKYKGKVKLEGHCDERGSDEYNLALGENRAKAALNYLVTLGVPSDQLSVVSYGKEKPVDNGHTEEAWAKNRRVEFTVVK
ncbi:MAG: peptidoglycan-associated lipoprotein Pal [Geobacteraceae bacterium]|nr:peptidoglycan-associated lipoprotein Pal [Geobacteraceae bacterium]